MIRHIAACTQFMHRSHPILETYVSIRLSDPLSLPCGGILPNRIAKAAMTEGLADNDGRATARNVRLYEQWGAGGAGLLLTGNILIDHRFLERPRNVIVERGRDLGALRELAAAATAHGAQCWVQINHPGRQAGLGAEQFVGPSAVPYATGSDKMTRALTSGEIHDIIDRFAYVAETVRDCGFTGVQIHAAHGYLNSQFLSPLTNLRDDEWGGSLENRARMLLSAVRAVRKAVGPDFPLSVKLNSADFQQGGFTEDESLTVIGWLEKAGIDLLEISGGNYESKEMVGVSNPGSPQPARRASTVAREAYFVAFADRIRPHTSVPLMVTGGFRSRAGMDAALASGALDVVGIGRPFCTDPAVAAGLLSGALGEAPSPDRAPHIPREAMPEADDKAHFDAEVESGISYNYNRIRDLADGTETASKSDWLRNLRSHEAIEAIGAAAYHARHRG